MKQKVGQTFEKVQVGNDQEKAQSEKRFPLQNREKSIKGLFIISRHFTVTQM